MLLMAGVGRALARHGGSVAVWLAGSCICCSGLVTVGAHPAFAAHIAHGWPGGYPA